MPFSKYLESKRADLKRLVGYLGEKFSYVSVLGTDVKATVYMANRNAQSVRDGSGECGFVAKMHDGNAFYEYSFSEIGSSVKDLADKILSQVKLADGVKTVDKTTVNDEKLVQSFLRESDFEKYSDGDLLTFCVELKDSIMAKDKKAVNAAVMLQPYTVSKIFISKNRELDQHYGWVNGICTVTYADGKIVQPREGHHYYLLSEVLENLPKKVDKLLDKARHLAKATPIKPGVYDVITDSSITGLIAHEAFGHGVEMDQFVKERALAKEYVGKYVASPITNMRDGAGATLSAASYFFDDDGVLAHDTQIIKNGVLVTGISDLVSASVLGTEPTGNGRRESYKRKAYSRMTNTFFERGTDKLEDMIKSIKHGYMLFETNNGMEDPKNWQIQCTAEYGIEIVDGKLTENYVSPVVMSGSVPELLKSITMISDDFEVIGAGSCGKGYKEWVRVSDGGPCLKVKVKLA
ncbi:MAG: TldD/PmbA family protein [Clostridia bacterium]|nr:TldD/PmbA family protein [Clostridia bacterium]